ncbi:unnamed protein product [Ectocarpus sp. CCAP 1310/34]|nr:unnamed protein product [Ectocarpus sp. CCAP 1310/34]
MLVTFTRRNRLWSDECSSSSSGDYCDICLSGEGTNKTTYSRHSHGYPSVRASKWSTAELNFGYCTLLVMEDLDVIPRHEVRSVNVQLVTYNGNQGSAFGSINLGFTFDHERI